MKEYFTSKQSQLIVDTEKKIFSWNDRIQVISQKQVVERYIPKFIDDLRKANYKRVPLVNYNETPIGQCKNMEAL
jgi:hypothetical protein